MKYLVIIIAILSMSTAAGSKADRALTTCAPSSGVTLQVLGSSGPVANDGRESTGYLDGSAGLIKLEPSVVDLKLQKASLVYSDPDGDLEVFAIGVPHGPLVSSNDLQYINF